LRDLLIAPAERREPPAPRDAGRAPAPSLGVLAPARELPAVALAVAVAIARGRHAALVCLPGRAAASPRLPARPAAARLASSLRARGLAAEARGRLALAGLPDDPAELASAAARALAAGGALPTVLAVARRTEAVDALLGARDAIVVALAPSADPALADLALAGATALAPSAALPLTLDPIQRALALAGAWSPRTIHRVVEGLVR
jgi:hypothetical protein